MQREDKKSILLWLVAIGFFMETLDSTIVNTALPSMARSLGESPLLMESVVIAYSLTLAVMIPATAWIVDRLGTRRVFLGAIFLFTMGSLSCAMSQSLTALVISRVVQGIGGSMLLPVGRLAVLRAFPGEAFLAAISFVTVPGLIGPLLGPTLGGWLVQFASWHWIFLINLPIGVLGFIATYLAMPQSEMTPGRRFDFMGFAQLSLSMLAISFGLEGFAELNFPLGLTLVLVIFGMACLASYAMHAAKDEQPLFPLGLFGITTYRIGLLGNFFARVGSSAMPFLVPLSLQVGMGYSPFAAGALMLPISIASIVVKRYGTRVILRAGYRKILMVNTLLTGLGIASFAFVSPSLPLGVTILQLAFFGGVNSLQFTAMNTLVLKDLKGDFTSTGNSLFSMVQMLAMSFAVAAAAALLKAFALETGGPVSPAAALHAFHATFLCMGAITCTSSWVFWQLPAEIRMNRKDTQSAGVAH